MMPLNQIFKIGLKMLNFVFNCQINNKIRTYLYEIDLRFLFNPFRKFMLNGPGQEA